MENPIDKDKTTDSPGLLPYSHHVGSLPIRPEDRGKIKSRALSAMYEQTEMQMKNIQEQIRLLADQAFSIKKRVEVSESIYLLELRFEPLVGHVYYLYDTNDGSRVLSVIGPGEWGKSFPYKCYVSAVKLLADHTWEVLES